ncbi:MAG: hypothetical protein IPL46_31320 [Saprospiraceae bacterium]|nr:hypothetical protein [Saprospiraceae bacterium]
MNRTLYILLSVTLIQASLIGQSTQGRFCLQYFPQPLVESYVDSLVSYLTKELGDEESLLDSTTEEYIEHFASLATRKSKCVYFTSTAS